jgi:IclR family KDG regulon transcriptional repressor
MIQGNTSNTSSRSVLRALSIINKLGEASKGITEISKELKLSKGMIFSLMKTLESMGYVTQDTVTEKYTLGPVILELASKNKKY